MPSGENTLVDRMSALPHLSQVPRAELEWLVEHGSLEVFEPGDVVAPKGERIETCWVIVSGVLSVRVDRGVGPRQVIEWGPGELSGMLPYSRMTAPPGDNRVERRAELLVVDQEIFPEMIQMCPTVTAQAVHSMVDRARSFNASDLHDEKMVALGRLAAGLAHELNNPASAAVRAAKLLAEGLTEVRSATKEVALGGLDTKQLGAIEGLLSEGTPRKGGQPLSPIERSDREERVYDWLEAHGAASVSAAVLVDASIGVDELDRLAVELPPESLVVALRWVGAHRAAGALAVDIGSAAEQISELVGAIKRFTFMDSLAGPEAVEVEPGLRDTLRVLAARADSKGATVSIDVEPDLPAVRANGAELNQIWLSLIGNALDAIPDAGRVEIVAERKLDRVVVRVIDDGHGIPPDLLPVVFDPFVTTKAPGQGTGLGLDIARRLARGYKGDITVASEPGRTEFCVSLPVESG